MTGRMDAWTVVYLVVVVSLMVVGVVGLFTGEPVAGVG